MMALLKVAALSFAGIFLATNFQALDASNGDGNKILPGKSTANSSGKTNDRDVEVDTDLDKSVGTRRVVKRSIHFRIINHGWQSPRIYSYEQNWEAFVSDMSAIKKTDLTTAKTLTLHWLSNYALNKEIPFNSNAKRLRRVTFFGLHEEKNIHLWVQILKPHIAAKVTFLQISYTTLTGVDSHYFHAYKNLDTLNLMQNKLCKVPACLSTQAPRIIKLSFNDIYQVKSDDIQDSGKVRQIFLGYNRIRRIELPRHMLVKGFQLDLSSNFRLKCLPDYLRKREINLNVRGTQLRRNGSSLIKLQTDLACGYLSIPRCYH